ncbi:MAG TPA: iron-containing redox enzyme family protein [Pyrinomonadaceae bacterium]|nr:iron-containing redox enzyme family protein [Pyrinomonadaceae bacterium]
MATKLELANEAKPVDQFLADLQTFIQQHHPRDSKIIQGIVNGSASKAALQKFAKEFYAYSAFSVRPFAALVANAPDETSYKLMLQNFAGEAGLLNTPPHPVLYRDFTLATGVTEEELDTHIPLPTTLGAMYTLSHFLRGPFDEAIAGFGFAIEGPAAEWGRMIHDGLRKHYDFDEKAMTFWAIHLAEDEEGSGLEEQHGENARRLMTRFASGKEQQTRIGNAFMYSALVFENFWKGMDQFVEQ